MKGRPRLRVPAALEAYRAFRSGDWEILARPEHAEAARSFLGPIPAAGILRLAGRPAAAAPPASGRGATILVDGGGGRRLVVKLLRRGGLAGRLRGEFHGRARLLGELATLEEAIRRGVPAAAPAFGAAGRTSSGTTLAVLATVEVAGSESLAEIAAGTGAPASPRARREALRAAGGAVRRAHDAGLDHADLNVGNVLVVLGAEPQGRPEAAVVVDLGASRVGAPLPLGRRAANLVRLLRSAEKHLGAPGRSPRDAAAFLRGYLDAGGGGRARRAFRGRLLAAIRMRLPALALHRLGWALSGSRRAGAGAALSGSAGRPTSSRRRRGSRRRGTPGGSGPGSAR